MNKWTIRKRYSEILKLHQHLKKKHFKDRELTDRVRSNRDLGDSSITPVCPKLIPDLEDNFSYPVVNTMKELFKFPPKKALKNRSSVVESRKLGLEEFLNRMARWVDLLHDDLFCKFANVLPQTRQYLEEL